MMIAILHLHTGDAFITSYNTGYFQADGNGDYAQTFAEKSVVVMLLFRDNGANDLRNIDSIRKNNSSASFDVQYISINFPSWTPKIESQ